MLKEDKNILIVSIKKALVICHSNGAVAPLVGAGDARTMPPDD